MKVSSTLLEDLTILDGVAIVFVVPSKDTFKEFLVLWLITFVSKISIKKISRTFDKSQRSYEYDSQSGATWRTNTC